MLATDLVKLDGDSGSSTEMTRLAALTMNFAVQLG